MGGIGEAALAERGDSLLLADALAAHGPGLEVTPVEEDGRAASMSRAMTPVSSLWRLRSMAMERRVAGIPTPSTSSGEATRLPIATVMIQWKLFICDVERWPEKRRNLMTSM